MAYLKDYFKSVKNGYKVKNHIVYYVLGSVFAILLVLVMTDSLDRITSSLLGRIGYTMIAAISLSLVVGFLGELSLGHAAFMALGAFIGGYMQQYTFASLTSASPLLSIIIAMLIGGTVAAIFGFIVGLPALRLKGDYLAIVTLAFCEIVKVIFQNSKKFGNGNVLETYKYDRGHLLLICLIVLFIALAVIMNLIKSKHGRAIMAIRDNEIAARAMGVNVTYYKLMVFVLSSFFAGIAGVLFANASGGVKCDNFSYDYSIDILVMVVLGGMGSIKGSMIAAALITYLDTKLPIWLNLEGNWVALPQMLYALILILIVIYTNAPKLKGIREKYNIHNGMVKVKGWIFRLFARGKYQHKPDAEHDYRADWSKVPTKIEMDAILSTDFTPDNTYVPDKPDKPKGGKN
ncbi:MAG: branched-chain amino acid ABC transporter permease [Clostridiales bacterium]|nr:branched-chain amino acid ABC transporter permease [Clostridiales bacterium]